MLARAKAIVCLALLSAFAAVIPAPVAAAPGDAFIVIANKTYRSGIAPVEFADRDGDAIEKAARDVLGIDRLGLKRFDDMTVGEGSGWFRADGTPGEDLTGFVRRASQGRRDATVYFYYSGHGITARNAVREKDELHLVLHDTRTDDISRQGLSIEAVKSALAQVQQQVLPNGRVVMLIDACFSGFGRDGKEIYKGSRAGAVAASLAPLPKVVVLAAAGPSESAWSDLARRHGAFTDAVLDGLYGAAADDRGQITAERMLSFVGRRVAGRLSRQPGGARYQTPTLAGDSAMVIAALKTPLRMERDPGRRENLELRCTVVSASTDMTDMREFLKSECDDDCPCRAAIETKIADFERDERRCKLEADQFSALKTRGASALPGIRALAGVVKCPTVKMQIAAAILDLDAVAREERRRELEKKAKDDAEQAARADARKKIEGEFARELEAAGKRAEELYTAAVRRKAEELATSEQRKKAQEEAERKSREAAARERKPPEDTGKAREIEAVRLIKPGRGQSFRDTFSNGRDCAHCPQMVVVPSGTFLMGTSKDEISGLNLTPGQVKQETPQRAVTIARPFAVGRHPITRKQFATFAAETGLRDDSGCRVRAKPDASQELDLTKSWHKPGFQQDDNHPVVCVSWFEATAYVKWLSSITGRDYRLPSEAEREYVARAGTTTRYHFGNSISPAQANFDLKHRGTTRIGSFPLNPWGLYDVHGNVWNWVEDVGHEDRVGMPTDGSAWVSNGYDGHRVVRGGSWDGNASELRSAFGLLAVASDRFNDLGFRVARTLTPR